MDPVPPATIVRAGEASSSPARRSKSAWNHPYPKPALNRARLDALRAAEGGRFRVNIIVARVRGLAELNDLTGIGADAPPGNA